MHAIEIKPEITANHELHLKLPDNIKYDSVKVIVMYDELTNDQSERKNRQFGQFKGQINIKDDFDDALPDDFWNE